MKFILSICFLAFSTTLFGQQSEFGWLIGTWQEVSKNSFEVWKAQDSFLSGISYHADQTGNKTVTEDIKLIKKGNDFYYVPDVAGPQGPVEFRVTSLDSLSFSAENPAHDFPKKIMYRKISKQQLEATISGISGGNKSITYSFKKIK